MDLEKNKSTTNALSLLLDDILLEKDKGNGTGVAFLDLKKAFDTIHHNILLHKLGRSGLGPRCICFLTKYLSNRQQKTVANGKTSYMKGITTGVPQGSTLGPLLFLLYINDLPNADTDANNLMFADDTALYVSGNKQIEIQTKLQQTLNTCKVKQWCDENQLPLNAKKTQLCPIHIQT